MQADPGKVGEFELSQGTAQALAHGGDDRLDAARIGGLGDGIRGLVSDWRARLRTGPSLHLDVEGDWSGLSGEASASLYRTGSSS
jgi:hypothetical protein